MMQQSTAFYDSTYTGPTTGITGLCPSNFAFPNSANLVSLDISLGGTGVNRTTSGVINARWTDPNLLNLSPAGYINGTNSFVRNDSAYISTSGQTSTTVAIGLNMNTDHIRPQNGNGKNNGFPIRCLLNPPKLPTAFSFTCSPNQVNLSSIPVDADTLLWYDSPDSATPLHQGLDFSVPTSETARYYYVASYDTTLGQESSERLAIPVSANQCSTFADFAAEKAQLLIPCTTSECFPESSLELVDERDNKVYTVRRFADNNIWLADNLAYGGDTTSGGSDNCAERTSFTGYTTAASTNRFGPNTHGDCRNNPGYPGYLYNWQAFMQSSDAVYGTVYTGSSNNVVGLCPSGFIVPNSTNLINLDKAFGGTGVNRTISGAVNTRWLSVNFFNGSTAGYITYNNVFTRNGRLYIFSTTQNPDNETTGTLGLRINSEEVRPQNSNNKGNGFPIRCLLPLE